MDSTSSSFPIASSDALISTAVVVSEDDGSLSIASGLAKEAGMLFQAGKYVDCLRVLNQLLQRKDDDPKVLHNIAIVENIQDGYSNPRRLIKALENVKKRSEELACASREHVEVLGNDGSKITAGVEGSNGMVHQFSSSPVGYSDEFDSSVATFNIAVIWFHLHDYAKSFSFLEALYQNIEPIDEGTALRICLLLLDVSLLSYHASRSADVISYMEKAFGVNSISQVDDGNSAQQQPAIVSISTSVPSKSTIPDGSDYDSITTANTLVNSLPALSEEVLEDESLQLLSSLGISEQSHERRSGLPSSNDLLRTQAEESISAADLKLKLHLFKVRFLLLTRNLKAAKREVKMAMNVARGKDYPTVLYLKSQLEYARGNHCKAIKLLMASSNHAETGISSMYYNNLGCIYYQLGKYHTSGVFFSKALNSSSLLRKEKPLKLMSLSQDKSLLITYNCGVHHLACGRPFHAVRCFRQASLIFYNRPLLWLRIAECCLVALEKGLMKSIPSTADRSDIRVNVIGKGKWRQLAVKYCNSTNGQQEFIGKGGLLLGDGKQPDLSMSLAWQCLVNALYLLEISEGKYSGSGLTTEESESREKLASPVSSGSSHVLANAEVKEQKSGSCHIASLQNSVPGYEDICINENQMIKQAVLADLAYVELAIRNPLKALATAKSLLKLPKCSRIYNFLGNMYATEALCLLNRPMEAADVLMTYVSCGNNVEFPYSQEDCEKWKVEKAVDCEESNGGSAAPNVAASPIEFQGSEFLRPEEARGTFCANYAANCALLGDLERADHFVTRALSEVPNSIPAILTAIYLDLKRGKTPEAIAKLKQYSGVRFVLCR
ncbi:unnamed protein product [Fraxinus pennsylvanica]|uniref:CCR4-NOT transcription complex subunit 10 n=1 Tax=Fraxinus pennsylvanica TaxID=56036 RepID=A0AAD2AFW9_9LAMI|nr:unnamed protein product [Fraxinus pennsylvanica]